MLKRIKLLREQYGISQQKLGEIIGVSQQSINKYENHNVEPDIKTLKLMADYFNTSVDFIIEYTDIPHKIEKVTPAELNNRELSYLNKFRALSEKQKQSVESITDNYLDL